MSIIGEIVKRDYARIKSKGASGILISATICVSFLILITSISKELWPLVMDLMATKGISKWSFVLFSTYFASVFSFLFYNGGFLIIYRLQSPFFEQYKVMKNEKWPWLQDSKAWPSTLFRSLLIVSFNSLIMTPVSLYILSCAVGHKINY